MKKIILSAILLFTAPSFAADCKDMVYNRMFPVAQSKVTILCKNGFVIGYSQEQKTLLWVAERIDPNVKYIISKRPSFHKDPTVPPSRQSASTDFIGTGYDKGHMVPFEDMSYGERSAYDSMSLTNIVPQNFNNNRGGWKTLEMYARKMAQTNPIYVVSGPIFEGKTDYIGNGVPIPTKLFKVIVNPKAGTSKTYILPNVPVSGHEVEQYVSTRSQITVVDPTPNSKLKDVR